MRVAYILKRYITVGVLATKLNEGINLFRKIFRVLQLLFEIIASVIIFPFTIFRHKRVENWLVEEGRRVMVRTGELLMWLGFELDVMQK
jgi:hypothetical protein